MSKLEGTVSLAGLLEGPYTSESESGLRQWLKEMETAGVHFQLSHDGALFSIIPRTESPILWKGKAVDKIIGEGLQDLLERLPETFAKHCMCTLRSVEIFPGQERQTLYSMGPRNNIVVDQRDVPADTIPPAAPLDTRKLLRNSLIGAGILLLLFIASIPFVPYRNWAGRVQTNLLRTPAAELTIDLGPFENLIEVQNVSWEKQKNKYLITLRPKSTLTRKSIEIDKVGELSPKNNYAAEDLIRGRLTLEILSAEKSLGIKEVYLLEPSLEGNPDDTSQQYRFLLPSYAKMKSIRLRL